MSEKQEFVKCKNCTYEIRKNSRRCPYCGILNPTVTAKEVLKLTIIMIVLIYIVGFFIK